MDLLNTPLNSTNNNNNYNDNNNNDNSNFSLSSMENTSNEKFHEFFKNNEISIGFTLQKLSDGSINSNFYMSNLLNKNLTDIKINFMVQRFVTLKVISTSGNNLGQYENKGIKKVKN
jgi:hypothetical protein